MERAITRLGNGAFVLTRELTGFGGSVNASLFLFEGVAAVVDTLCSPRDMAGFAELASLNQTTVVYTHADWDHCLGTAAFPTGTVVAHEIAAKRLWDRGQDDFARILLSNSSLVEGASIVLPHLTFGERFADGRVEVFHLPGHTEDSSVVWVPQKGVLAAGDAVEDALPSVGNPKRLGEWAKALWEWADKASWVIPGHGEPQGPEICRRNARYLEALMNSVRLNTPFGVHVPDTSLDRLAPETAARLEEMSLGEQRFYWEVHKENVRRVLELTNPNSGG